MDSNKLQQVEKWTAWFMAGFGLSTCFSVAAANIFLGLGIASCLYRLYLKHDDLFSEMGFARKLIWAFLLYVFVSLISAASSAEPLHGFRVVGDYFVYRVMGLWIVLLAVHRRKHLWIIAGFLAASIVLNNAVTVVQGILHLAKNDRPAGFMFYMAQGGILSAAVPVFSLALVVCKKQWKKYALAALFISILALIYNGTRGAWLAAAVTAPLTAWLAAADKKKFFLGFLAALVLLGGCFAASQHVRERIATLDQADYQSNHERMLMWASAFHMFEDHPVFGVGFGQYEHEYQTRYILPEAKERDLGHAHSNVMQALGERGALGLAAFMWLWAYSLYFAVCGWRRERNPAYLAFFAVVLGVMLQGLTEYNMGTTVVSKFYWFAQALCLQWIRLTKGEIEK